MASENHKKLAMVIKDAHNRLRKNCGKYGPKEAWSRHIAQTDNLKNYATSMHELAITHWNPNNQNPNGNIRCRIQWAKNQCYEYFLKGGKEKYHQREIDIINKLSPSQSTNNLTQEKFTYLNNLNTTWPDKLDLLDVGSCYNPFADDKYFNVTAIDLAPYNNKVLQCDFLNVNLGSETIISDKESKVLELGKNSFNVCIFSLLLEYFPCPKQRFLCCKKAYELLKESGLLIIITPDSKHVHAHAKIMKSWRFILANLGFMRITYEKLTHLHCLTFRKCINKDTAVRWIKLQHNISKDDILFSSNSNIYIPKDFQSLESETIKSNNLKFEESDLVSAFHELPDMID